MRQAGNVFDLLLGRKSSRRLATGSSRRRAAERRAAEAARRVDHEQEDLATIEQDLADDIDEIRREWDAKAVDVEVLQIGLERDDVSVDEAFVVWVPR